MVSGANTAVSKAALPSETVSSRAGTDPSINARAAVTRCEIGLTSTNASSQPGSVSGSTNTLLRKTSGNRAIEPALETAFGARINSPTAANPQARPAAKATTRATAATTPGRPASGW